MNATRDALVADLVRANRILAAKGIFDAFGHVSVRLGADRFLLARNIAPGQVVAADIVDYDLDGEAMSPGAPRPYLERFIHGEIYRRRADVTAIVHNHAPALIPFGVVPSAALRPICHMAGFIADAAPVFEIRNEAGEASDLLIRTRALGAALARDLGAADLILMRGHGVTIVADDIRLAVYRAIYAEVNARLQLQAHQLGEPVFLTTGEASSAKATNEGQIERPWRIWCEDVGVA